MSNNVRALGHTMDEEARLDLTSWGYIPGNRSFYCDDCQAEPYPTGNWPHRGDSNSTRCIEHAIEARFQIIRCHEGSPAVHLTIAPPVSDKHIHSATVTLGALVFMVAVALLATL